MKCEICNVEIPADKNSVVCSDRCSDIRKMIYEMNNKYFHCNGCENCWGDLHQGCTEQCQKERRDSLEFGKDLWQLVRFILKKT